MNRANRAGNKVGEAGGRVIDGKVDRNSQKHIKYAIQAKSEGDHLKLKNVKKHSWHTSIDKFTARHAGKFFGLQAALKRLGIGTKTGGGADSANGTGSTDLIRIFNTENEKKLASNVRGMIDVIEELQEMFGVETSAKPAKEGIGRNDIGKLAQNLAGNEKQLIDSAKGVIEFIARLGNDEIESLENCEDSEALKNALYAMYDKQDGHIPEHNFKLVLDKLFLTSGD